MNWRYLEENSSGDHICYCSDTYARRSSIILPGASVSLDAIFGEIVAGWSQRLSKAGAHEAPKG